MSDTYTLEEFSRCYSLRGYGRKKEAAEWMLERRMDDATDDDFERCYHDLHQNQITARGCKWIAMCSDGQNMAAPSNMENSRGKSFNALMREAQREIDAAERAEKNRMETDSYA